MVDKSKINDLLKNSNADDETMKKVDDFLSKISESDINKINSILSDKKATEKHFEEEVKKQKMKHFSDISIGYAASISIFLPAHDKR